jgi:hypothetical protein
MPRGSETAPALDAQAGGPVGQTCERGASAGPPEDASSWLATSASSASTATARRPRTSISTRPTAASTMPPSSSTREPAARAAPERSTRRGREGARLQRCSSPRRATTRGADVPFEKDARLSDGRLSGRAYGTKRTCHEVPVSTAAEARPTSAIRPRLRLTHQSSLRSGGRKAMMQSWAVRGTWRSVRRTLEENWLRCDRQSAQDTWRLLARSTASSTR